MPRKIYDIKPPKTVHKAEKESGGVKIKKMAHSTTRPTRTHNKKDKRSFWWPVSTGILAVLLVVGVYLFFKLPKADIIIWPKVDTLSFQQTITADKSVNAVDITKAVVPAQYFEASKTESQDFPATGSASADGKATGTITIYNKSDPPTAMKFIAGTHFISDSGKLFVALQKISIPAAKKSGGSIAPGSVQVQVQAVEAGSDYNIPPSNFSIPGLKGTSSYYSVYATSTSAMSGGHTGTVKEVTGDDIQGAKDVMTKKTTADAISALKSQISSDYILLDTAVFSSVVDASTQTKSGTVAEDFNYQATVKASALAFKKADLEQFAKTYINSQVPQGKILLDSSFRMDYSAASVDVSNGKATLNLNFSSGTYKAVDKNSITLSLLGENADQIKETINNSLQNSVSNVKINFWPFWVTSAPNNQNAVKVELKF